MFNEGGGWTNGSRGGQGRFQEAVRGGLREWKEADTGWKWVGSGEERVGLSK